MARRYSGQCFREKTRLDAMAEEGAPSRLYGGIHYRFDNDTGLPAFSPVRGRVGRTVAALALSLDVNGHQPFVLR